MFNLIKRFFNLQKNMANTQMTPINKEDKSAALKALAAYKLQNPLKYAAKKESLFTRYGIEIEPVEEIDEEVLDLEKEAKKVKKINIV